MQTLLINTQFSGEGGDSSSNAESTAIGVGIGGQGGNANVENENTNVNFQDQQQYQGQGQSQNAEGGDAVGIGISEGSSANASNSNDITFEASESKRNVPSPVLPGFPQGPSYFSDVPMTEEFMSIEDLARLNSEWSDVTVKSFSGWQDSTDFDDVEYSERILYSFHDPSEKVKISFANPRHQRWKFIGILTAKAKKNVDMTAVMSTILQGAVKNGANLIYPINQGAKRVLSASSVGVAFGYTHVVIGGGTSGFGWAKGETSYRHEPFLRVGIFKVGEEEYKNVPTFTNGADMNEMLKKRVIDLQKKVEQYKKESETKK